MTREYKMRKIFDVKGEYILRFPKNDTEKINKWLSESGIELHPERIYQFAKEVNCPVFGVALDFPCSIIEE